MKNNNRLIRIFISSPSDVPEERSAARELIHQLTSDLYGHNAPILLPIGWDKELSTGFGKSPQVRINEDLLPDSDLLIGIFGETIGTCTEEYLSGTVEEINRHTSEGKQAFLFFKKVADENAVSDKEQYTMLKNYKKSKQTECVYVDYGSIEDFKNELRSNLIKYVLSTIREPQEDQSVQPDIKMLDHILDQWAIKLELESMNEWLSNFTCSVFRLSEEKYDSLHSLMLWLFGIKWDLGNEDFADAFSKFGQILRDALNLIVEATHLNENGIYMLEKNYQRATYGSDAYDYLAKTYDFHTDLIKDYGAELCRATNFIIDLYREKVNRLYLIKLGNIYVVDGPDIRLKYYYKYCKYGDSDTIPYISFDEFLVSRTERDLYFGAGKDIKDIKFLETYRKR